MVSGVGNEEDPPALNLVAMVDILTNLLFFLLTIFASQHLALDGRTGVNLPQSKLGTDLKESIVVSLSKTELVIEKTPIAQVKDGAFDVEVQGDQIVPLYNRLTAARASKNERGATADDNTILLMADKDVEYSLLSKVLKTAAMAGYPNFNLVAIRK